MKHNGCYRMIDKEIIKIVSGTPLTVTVNYEWIADQIRKRIGYLPDDIQRVFLELDVEQKDELEEIR